jgi:hypothetical protein
MKTYWIIGGGKFGLKAADTIVSREKDSTLVIVEQKPRLCEALVYRRYEVICAEGIAYLNRELLSGDEPDWIVPAIPVHVAFEWIKARLDETYDVQTIPIPKDLDSRLPNPLKANTGKRYVSNADFICPENCSEPENICTHTGKPRPRILNAFLSNIKYGDFHPVVICSQQLYPGVGGYTPRALLKALHSVEQTTRPVLLSTACRCHGVLDAFQISPKGLN